MAIALADSLTFFGTGTASSVHLNTSGSAVLSVVSISVNQSDANRISTVTDSSGNTYYRAQGIGGTSIAGELWYALNATYTALTTVTVTPANSADVWSAVWAIFTGVATASPLDNSAMTAGTAATATSITMNKASRQANSLVLSWVGQGNNRPVVAGTGYTAIMQIANGTVAESFLQYKVVSATGTYSATSTWDLASNYIAGLTIFSDTANTTGSFVNETMATINVTGSLIHNNGTGAGWQAGGFYQFNNNINQYGVLEYQGFLPSAFTASESLAMSTVSGADASWFYYGCSATPLTESDATGVGYLINRNDFGNTLEVRYAGAVLTSVTYTKDINYDALSIAVSGQTFTISYLGSVVITYTDPTARTLPGTKYGWGARSGGTANTHTVKNLSLSVAAATIVAHNLLLLGVGV